MRYWVLVWLTVDSMAQCKREFITLTGARRYAQSGPGRFTRLLSRVKPDDYNEKKYYTYTQVASDNDAPIYEYGNYTFGKWGQIDQ